MRMDMDQERKNTIGNILKSNIVYITILVLCIISDLIDIIKILLSGNIDLSSLIFKMFMVVGLSWSVFSLFKNNTDSNG